MTENERKLIKALHYALKIDPSLDELLFAEETLRLAKSDITELTPSDQESTSGGVEVDQW